MSVNKMSQLTDSS